MTDLFWGTSGPPDASVVLVAESWGVEEQKVERPLVGSSGIELDRILARAGINRNELLLTNVVAAQPQGNEMWRFFEPKETATLRIGGLAPLGIVFNECQRLYRQIAAHPRKLVIVAGNYALWSLTACTGTDVVRESNGRAVPKELQTWIPTGITSWRGSMWHTEPRPEFVVQLPQIPLLPIVHPAAIMRQWTMRDPTIHDLKTRVPLALKGDWRPNPQPIFLAPPTFNEAVQRLQLWLSMATRQPLRLAVDIETARGLITCLGLADSPHFAISIPFVQKSDTEGLVSYWTVDQEATIISLLRRLLHHPSVLIDGQNFIYDTQYIQHFLGVTPRLSHDTMLCQNVVFPGTPKDLGHLSSLYCHYHWYWKDDGKEWSGRGDLQQLLRYNCMDCIRTWEIAESQRLLLTSLKMHPQMALKMQTNALCLRMMNRGVRIDTDRRRYVLNDLQSEAEKLHDELLQIIPQEWVRERKKPTDAWWFNSDKQTKFVLYEMLGFRGVSHRKTGNPTTGKEALRQFRRWYPEWRSLLRRLDLLGSLQNTVNVLKTPLDLDGRMRCSYNPGGTETHRLSSSANVFGRGTNLQNLTKGEEDE